MSASHQSVLKPVVLEPVAVDPLAAKPLCRKSSLVGGETGGSREMVYWHNGCSGLSAFAVKGRVFQTVGNARAILGELLSEEEWNNLKRTTETDLWKCRLIYVELASIISLFVDCPFGGVTERAQKTVGEWLQGAGGRRIQNNWITGCLLQRAGVSTKKLIDFIVDALGYVPANCAASLECLNKCEMRYSNYVRRVTTKDRRELLLERERILPAAKITVAEFVEEIGCAANCPTGGGRAGPRRLNSRLEKLAGPVYCPGTGSLERSVRNSVPGTLLLHEVGARAAKLLEGRVEKLLVIEDDDFKTCSLDYAELGTVIDKYVRNAFGGVCRRVLNKTATAMEEGTRSRRVNGWISACLLQYAEVPIEDLVDLCIQELKHRPPTVWRLDCLKGHSDLYRARQRRGNVEPKTRFLKLLCGLREKISVPQFKRLASLTVQAQAEFLFERYSAFVSSGYRTVPDGTAPNATVPTATALGPTVPSAPGRTVLDPEMMYCHPDDLIEFLQWVESGH